MSNNTLTNLAAVALAFAAGGAVAQDSVALAWSPEPGSVMPYLTRRAVKSEATGQEGTKNRELAFEQYVILQTPAGERAEEGKDVPASVVFGVVRHRDGDGTVVSFDYDDARDRYNQAKVWNPAVKELASLRFQRLQLQVAPSGDVSVIGGYDELIEGVIDFQEGFGVSETIKPKNAKKRLPEAALEATLSRTFSGLSGGESSIGDTWTGRTREFVDGVAWLDVEMTYKLDAVETDEQGVRKARISGTGEVIGSELLTQPGMRSPELIVGVYTISSEIEFLPDEGRILNRERTTDLECRFQWIRAFEDAPGIIDFDLEIVTSVTDAADDEASGDWRVAK